MLVVKWVLVAVVALVALGALRIGLFSRAGVGVAPRPASAGGRAAGRSRLARLWTWLVRILAVLAILSAAAFLHYTLPRHDVVRIVNTTERRVDTSARPWFWTNPQEAGNASTMQDVYFIETIRPDGRPMVYRNQDTGWGWPPYFKFDSSNLQAKARDLVSTSENPKWVVVTRYGWRNEFWSIYPNAVEIEPVDAPNVRIIPWFNIFFFLLLGGVILLGWRLWQQFRERVLDPWLDRIEEGLDDAEAGARRIGQRLRRLVVGIFGRG